ncbi:hypothetical protein ACHQM5_014007 [Ranunculus cassubicifolius]
MDWIRSTLLKSPKSTLLPTTLSKSKLAELELEKELGVTDQLQTFIKSFTLQTFKNFPKQDDKIRIISNGSGGSSGGDGYVQNDLNDWQERHAMLVLSKVKEIAQLRYVLCPRHLKETEFWRIYFALVKSHVTPYEIRAIQKAKLRRLGNEVETSNNSYEVEMSETKGTICASPSP